MVEYGRVPRKNRIPASIEKLSRRVPEKLDSCEYRKTVPTNTGKGSNLFKYGKMVESGCVPGEIRIRASIKKGLNICKYRKMVEFGRVPGKSRIHLNIEKLSRRVPEKGRICVSTKEWQNPGEYREKVESVRVSKNSPG